MPGESTHAHSHDHENEHGHGHDHTSKGSIHDGYFRDEQVQPRPLSDWEGEWQSIYPYLVDGTLNAVLAHKAKKGDKTVEEYRTYFDRGYRTETNRIVINGNRVAFTAGEDSVEGEYVSDGFEILTYEKVNRGVRYLFEKVDGDDKAPRSSSSAITLSHPRGRGITTFTGETIVKLFWKKCPAGQPIIHRP